MKYILIFMAFGLAACSEPPCDIESATKVAELYQNCIRMTGHNQGSDCGHKAFNTHCKNKKKD